MEKYSLWIVYPVGDVHGDLERTEAALRLAGVLSSDGQGRWVGGSSVSNASFSRMSHLFLFGNSISNTIVHIEATRRDSYSPKRTGLQVLVQVGDILDRGEDELAILSLLHNLGQQALLKGGAVFQVPNRSPHPLFLSLLKFI